MEKLNFNKEWAGFMGHARSWAIVAELDGGAEPSLAARWVFQLYATLCSDCSPRRMGVLGTMAPFIQSNGQVFEQTTLALKDHLSKDMAEKLSTIAKVRCDEDYKNWHRFNGKLSRLVDKLNADPRFIPMFVEDVGRQKAMMAAIAEGVGIEREVGAAGGVLVDPPRL